MLMTRDNFRNSVFNRDGFRCVICADQGQDAHHIMERRLFPDGGYYLDNGATLCGSCHLQAEATIISPDEIREAAGIKNIILPPHLYKDQQYTKWGDPVLATQGRYSRLMGELFHDESVQKVIKWAVDAKYYLPYVKYPRTYHLPWSENITSDDRVLECPLPLENKPVVVTEKMDGENTTLYKDYIHARSLDSRSHPSQNWVKNYHSQIAHDIPEGWRVCGENLFAKHSIYYDNLSSYFMGFSVWNQKNECLGWDETLEWFELLNIVPVKEIYRGEFSAKNIKESHNKNNAEDSEGYVVRVTHPFPYKDFRKSVGKFVRKNWAAGVQHWRYGQKMEINELKG